MLALAACSSSSSQQATQPTQTTRTTTATTTIPTNDRAALAADAYVWGSPLVITERTLQTFGRLVGVNKLTWQTKLSDPSSRIVVGPNVDTLYSIAVLDLRAAPMALTLPRITDRYYTYQFIDAWTDSFAYVGTRATDSRAGTWVITPPGWHDTLPPGANHIASPTNQVFLLGRFLVRDPADIANVDRLHGSISLQPVGAAQPVTLGPPAGQPAAVGREDASFYDELGDALAINAPATDADRAALARYASIGIAPGHHPYATGTPAARQALTAGVTRGEAAVATAAGSQTHAVNGWTTRLDIGTYTDPLTRAVVARFGWGANVPQEAVYSSATVDSTGQALNGTHTYVMHFAPGSLPPVKAFWSLTLYGPDHFLVTNNLQRYAISDRTPGIVRGADGSLDLYVGHDAPPGHESNWLPAPAGAFQLTLRMYLPESPILNGTYRLPPLRRVG
jgi:hypothetical protein